MIYPYIIAEVAQGYEGSATLVRLYMNAIESIGADAVKFQIFHADELALPDYKHYALFQKLELPLEVWKNAVEVAHQHGKAFYSDIFGTRSLHDLESIGVDGYKIHTTDINNTSLLRAVAQTKKRVLLSTGGCQLEEIDRAVAILKDCSLVLMYGFQAEPTEPEDNHLHRVRFLQERYAHPIGFQDHTAGSSSLATALPYIALGMGAQAIEKHLTLSRVAHIEDYVSALTPEEFRSWTSDVKAAYAGLGMHEWNLTEKEIEYRMKVKRAICAREDIQEGSVIREDDITLKRTGNAEAIFDPSMVIGRIARRAIQKNSVIIHDDIV